MKLLLDTHIWLWITLAPHRLASSVSQAVAAVHNELWLSSVSSWEALLLARKGRLHLVPDAESWIRASLIKTGFREAPLDHEVALASVRVPLPHGDPADRFLVATALVYDLTLVTADDRLIRANCCSVLANR